jgi:xanthine dehydrogenase YagS FAD-binding subunit
MITFVSDLADASTRDGTVRAGGTDLQERRRMALHGGKAVTPIVDLRDVAEARAIDTTGPLKVGALVTIAALADDDHVKDGYPGLAQAAGGLATPQIRAVATVGGNLLQHTRCWYYRTPEGECFKKGGSSCSARKGDHLWHACFDRGPCISVHASTLGMALLAYDARIDVIGATLKTVAELYGDGSDAAKHNMLPDSAVLRGIEIDAPKRGERSVYLRATSRARAEWPLVETLVRIGVEADKIAWAKVAVGAVAPVPLRLTNVESALVGTPARPEAVLAVAARASEGAAPLPMTGYKVPLLEGLVADALERALDATPVGGA